MNKIFFVAAMPPPVTGQANINAALFDLLSREKVSDVRMFNIAPIYLQRSILYHFSRVIRVVYALFAILFWRLLNIFNKSNFVAYLVYESGFGVVYNLIFVFLFRLIGVDIYLHHHTSAHALNFDAKFRILSYFLSESAKHIVLSEGMRNALATKYPIRRENFFVCENAALLNIPVVEKKRGCDSQIVIGYISNVSVEKGACIVFSNYKKIRNEGLDVKLLIAGPICDAESEESLRSLMSLYPDDVVYKGPVYGENKWDFYQSIDVLFFPTLYKYEAQPLVVLEAMSMSCPVFCLSAGFIDEIIPDSDWCVENEGLYSDLVLKKIIDYKNSDCYFVDSCISRSKFDSLFIDSQAQVIFLKNILLGV